MKLLFISSPVSSLKSGRLGGVAVNLQTIAREMLSRHHEVEIVAPLDSRLEGLKVTEIPGALQGLVPHPTYDDPVILPDNAVLANMWDYARQVQGDYDLILDFGYEWLPLYLSPFFQRPVLHYICIASWTAMMDRAIARVADLCPGTLGAHTQTQANTYPCPEAFRILGGGIDLTKYEFYDKPGDSFAWAGRISPEKGLEDAIAATHTLGVPLKVFGYLQDSEYWHKLQAQYPQADLEYRGFLSTQDFQRELRQCRALLMTHKWIEALGRVVLEALACGVPVIAYNRGGPSELVVDGESGWLVEPDSVEGLIQGIRQIEQIERAVCRKEAEERYSMAAFGDRLEQWFSTVQ
ncbi:glycosyltransferase family 4 protein [Spirulina subsalsa FACHB-351]|uniref:Glycosyltransferase family 4 protein n=1 Tax=Spirulina subsalsa FACHB-351 TaxID=234711 RepID=A0ABT3LB05_9CYAN|nr:glycosyltransferase family 4 protein [Spirulina subsalsa]MCW6038692.1 glycosyltransferase family 4 protein [Spirulina subsalsa FACHB-351]